MKARVKETNEIIEVECLYSVIYSRLDCNGKIVEEYDEDELEFLNSPKKMISVDKAVEWLRDNTMAELNLDFGISQLDREFIDHFKEATMED